MSEATDDVRRALTIVFRGTDGLARPDVERAFSFDMEWVGPHEAEQVVDALLTAGWLKAQGQNLCLAVEIGAVDVPFGWFPRPARLLNPAQASGSEEGVEHERTAVSTASERSTPSPGAGRPPQPAIADDPRARLYAPRRVSFQDRAASTQKNCNGVQSGKSTRSNSSHPGWPTPWWRRSKAW